MVQKYYAIKVGKGGSQIVNSWYECKRAVHKYSGAVYKSFPTKPEAIAYLNDTVPRKKQTPTIKTTTAYTHDLMVSETANKVVMYTDGACSGNNRKTAKTAGCGVYVPWSTDQNISEKLPWPPFTNTRAELYAVILALTKVKVPAEKNILIYTDNDFTVKCVNDYIPKWQRTDWKTSTGKEVLNQDLLHKLADLMDTTTFEIKHIPGHAGIQGNEIADTLAVQGQYM